MKNLSYVILDGNLTADPEERTIAGGKSLANFTVAVNHTSNNQEGKDKEDVSYFEVEAWEKLGENCVEYLKKGSKVTVMGNLKQNRWKSPEGESRSKIKVTASTVRFDSMRKKETKAA
ncbi:single-stranded DNA-binding protein [Leptospira sp. 85282-16]|uniref:Single-stranded DNA-binding protein n=1 Tax=Leptospira montravelensis TaxID=2484961 RepID=A0ABY2LP76_9LEPT|nr:MULTISPECIES: single-stranded DNA-binding protein [Leptospira]MCT8334657.1 single-stranded DNA-binding protein [Leptospira sp. 85282-16]TGK80998.1 single-stranded DNA-binding protein [Leptospira montravelensis]TGL01407.1 single-stranded DNA-binding protein [Leptospira montravelensis]